MSESGVVDKVKGGLKEAAGSLLDDGLVASVLR